MLETEKVQVNDFFVNCPGCDEYIETGDNYNYEEIECPDCGIKFIGTECNNKTF